MNGRLGPCMQVVTTTSAQASVRQYASFDVPHLSPFIERVMPSDASRSPTASRKSLRGGYMLPMNWTTVPSFGDSAATSSSQARRAREIGIGNGPTIRVCGKIGASTRVGANVSTTPLCAVRTAACHRWRR